ncbi:phage tail protein [Sodalis sp. RH24]|uniref:phage tail protein n=1 Tax=unclassified Sodalis (in: enterobacteria) TaxID=2636512 RepID=UPI0039B68B8B
MTTKYYALLTNLGAAKLANATALGTQLKLTHLAVGDGGGTLPTPDPAQSKLIGEQRRAALNSLSVDAANTNQIIAEQIIPENEGGFWIREIGLFDSDGTLIAIANCPETYKPLLQEGSGRTQTVRMILIISNTEAVTLKIDPSVVLATRQYVDNAVIEVKLYADTLLANHLKAAHPHSQYLRTANNLAEFKTAGAATVAAVLANLGLSNMVVPVGVPMPWPTATAPTGWLKCNGATFDKTLYPLLAQVYPAGQLPDLRGEFIRGFDDGRSVDSNRALLSAQGDAIRNITGAQSFVVAYNGASAGAFYNNGKNANEGLYPDGTVITDGPPLGNTTVGSSQGEKIYFDASRVVPTAAENRPRNIAFNYIVRVA